jgi:hypothetical protein
MEDARAKKTESTQGRVPPTAPHGRVVAPSATQRAALAVALDLIVDPRSAFMTAKTGLFSGRTIKEHKVESLQQFASALHEWPVMLRWADAVRGAANAGQLWFRELYLDQCRVLQFPIEASLPWILTEHALASGTPVATQALLSVLDLYNDAAELALRFLRQRFLFDEIEAELNLVFDQFLVLVADAAYADARDAATAALFSPTARALWDAHVRAALAARAAAAKKAARQRRGTLRMFTALASSSAGGGGGAGGAGWLEVMATDPATGAVVGLAPAETEDVLAPAESRVAWSLLRQRHVALLGRNVDLSAIVGALLNDALRRDVDAALAKFEADGFVGVVDLDLTLQALRATHGRLTEHVALDAFDVIVREVDDAASATADAGRVARAALGAALLDVVPHFAFCATTQRFVRGKGFTDEGRAAAATARRGLRSRFAVVGPRCARALDAATRPLRNFVGAQHMDALVRVLGPRGVGVLVDESILNAVRLLREDLAPYVPVLFEGLPPTPLPKFNNRATGAYLFFEFKLVYMKKYDDLKPRVFQALRELGNTLALVHLLEQALGQRDLLDYAHTLPFLEVSQGVAAGHPAAATGGLPPLVALADAARAALRRASDALGAAPGGASPGALPPGMPGAVAAQTAVLMASQGADVHSSLHGRVPLLARLLLTLAEALYAPDSSGGPSLAAKWGVVEGGGAGADAAERSAAVQKSLETFAEGAESAVRAAPPRARASSPPTTHLCARVCALAPPSLAGVPPALVRAAVPLLHAGRRGGDRRAGARPQPLRRRLPVGRRGAAAPAAPVAALRAVRLHAARAARDEVRGGGAGARRRGRHRHRARARGECAGLPRRSRARARPPARGARAAGGAHAATAADAAWRRPQRHARRPGALHAA